MGSSAGYSGSSRTCSLRERTRRRLGRRQRRRRRRRPAHRRGGCDRSTLITRSPLVRDPYEQRYVYVKESGLPMAGEGLYAKTNIKKVSLLI